MNNTDIWVFLSKEESFIVVQTAISIENKVSLNGMSLEQACNHYREHYLNETVEAAAQLVPFYQNVARAPLAPFMVDEKFLSLKNLSFTNEQMYNFCQKHLNHFVKRAKDIFVDVVANDRLTVEMAKAVISAEFTHEQVKAVIAYLNLSDACCMRPNEFFQPCIVRESELAFSRN